MENFSTKRSKKPLYIIAGVVVALVVVSIAVVVALGDSNRNQNTTDSSTGGETRDVATNEEVREGLEAIESSVKQSTDDQKSAKEALEDDKKQVKVGS